MYLNTGEKIQIVLDGAVTTRQLKVNTSFQDINASGMVLPQSGFAVNTNSAVDVDIVAAPAASTVRQITHIIVYNDDTVAQNVTIKKDISGTDYQLVRASLQAGNTLEWTREKGWTIFNQSTLPSFIITEFIASGTWTKPANLKAIQVCCIGAAGGAGSGRRGPAGENRYGGGAGGNGAQASKTIIAGELPASVTVTVGTGGTGGAGVTVDATNGNNGTAGGDTSFGVTVVAKGGGGGSGGSTASGNQGTAGQPSACTPPYFPSLVGMTGGSGQTTAASPGSTGGSGFGALPSAGGGGNGISSANVTGSANVSGGSIAQTNGTISSSTPAGTNGASNMALQLFGSTNITGTKGAGQGGGGGISTVNGGNGGNGGNYGASGGGGAASLNGTTSGKGGDGAGGLCVVLEIY